MFLTDDGCTDGTSEAVLNEFKDRNIIIVRSDGNAYWAGGMRIAWRKAIDSEPNGDFFLLINDDTYFKKNCIVELFKTNAYAKAEYGVGGIYTGFVSSFEDESVILYGAKKYINSLFAKSINVIPTGVPQLCELVNANILLVSKNVVDKIGILDDEFIHAAADADYGIRAHRAGLPVLTTSCVCGYSEFDHDNSKAEAAKVINMSFAERKTYLNKPNIKQYHDSLVVYKRYFKVKYVLYVMSYYLNLFFPSIYYKLYQKRGH